jgi:hypothetical protein
MVDIQYFLTLGHTHCPIQLFHQSGYLLGRDVLLHGVDVRTKWRLDLPLPRQTHDDGVGMLPFWRLRLAGPPSSILRHF